MDHIPAVKSDPAVPALFVVPPVPAAIVDSAARVMSSGRELASVGGTAATMTAGFMMAGAMAWAAGAAMFFAAATAMPRPGRGNGGRPAKVV